jgi:hypothetical protein
LVVVVAVDDGESPRKGQAVLDRILKGRSVRWLEAIVVVAIDI